MEKRRRGIASLIYLSLGAIGLIICININTNHPILLALTLALSIIIGVLSAFNLCTIIFHNEMCDNAGEISEWRKEEYKESLTFLKEAICYVNAISFVLTLILIILTIASFIIYII